MHLGRSFGAQVLSLAFQAWMLPGASSHVELSQTYSWFVLSFIHSFSLSVTNSCKAQANLDCNIIEDFAYS